VLNRAAAARFWPGEEAIGRQVFVGDSEGTGEWLTVVGVAEDVERGAMVERHWSTLYRPLDQAPLYHPAASLVVRISGPPHAALPSLHAAVSRALGHPTGGFRSVDEALATRFRTQRFNALALNLFAAFALLLAAMGIYGTVAYTVSRRTREIGVRVALGAEWRSVISLVGRDAVGIVAAGIALGLAGSALLARVLEGFVSATNVHDFRAFAVAALLVGVTALLAAYLPARRAAGVDPVVALRSE
jgi:putative ABC transport system permease protein